MSDETKAAEIAALVPAESEAAPASSKRLTKEQWLEIEAHIELDTMSTTDIAAKYGVSISAISQHLSRRRDNDKVIIKRGAKKGVIKSATDAAAAAIAVGFAKKKKIRIEETREQGYIMQKAIAAKGQQLVSDLIKGTKKAVDIADDIKALRHATKLVQDNVNHRLSLLDAHKDVDEEDLPTLTFRDLTDDDIRALQKGSEDEFGAEDLEDDIADKEKEEDVVEEGAEPAEEKPAE